VLDSADSITRNQAHWGDEECPTKKQASYIKTSQPFVF